MEKKEGYLSLRDDGRYELQNDSGEYITYFTSGDSIDIYVDNYGWISGSMEYSDDYGGYYFCNSDGRNRSLCNGIKARG